MVELAAPARRALEGAKVRVLRDLTRFTEDEVTKLHGIGPSAMKKLKDAMAKAGLRFSE